MQNFILTHKQTILDEGIPHLQFPTHVELQVNMFGLWYNYEKNNSENIHYSVRKLFTISTSFKK